MIPRVIRALLLWSCVFWSPAPAGTAEEPEESLHPLAHVKFEGVNTFDTDAIRSALLSQPDLQWALRYEAPQGELAAVLQEKVTAGYRQAGFGDVRVKVRPESGGGSRLEELIIAVQEGTRFQVGEVRFENAGAIPTAKVIERLALPLPPEKARAYPFDGDQGLQIVWLDFDGKEAECDPPLWEAGKAATFDESLLELIRHHLAAILSDVGFPQARFDTKVERVEAENRVDLVIGVKQVGRPAKIARIDVVGNQRNSREAILECLQVPPGIVFTREERYRIEKRLWDCGRFSDFYVRLLKPPSDDEPFVLRIDVEECPRVTPLGQPITLEEQVLLKARDWLLHFPGRDYELVYRNRTGQCVYSPQRGVLLIRDDGGGGQERGARVAMLARGKFALYDLDRGTEREFALPPMHPTLRVMANLTDDPDHFLKANLRGSTSSASEAETPPPELIFRVSPALFMSAARQWEWTTESEQLVARGSSGILKIDLRSGQFSAQSPDSSVSGWRVGFEQGAFAAWEDRIDDAMRRDNRQAADGPVPASIAEFVHLIASCDPSGTLGRIADDYRPWINGVDLLQQLLEDGLLDGKGDAEKRPAKEQAESFEIADRGEQTQNSLARMAWVAYVLSDTIFPRRSWPWVIWRDVVASRMSDQRFRQPTKVAFADLVRSDEQGPVVTLGLCAMFRRSPRLSQRLAVRGLKHLEASDFQKDYAPLIDDRYLCGRLVVRAADILRSKEKEELDALLKRLPPPLDGATAEVIAFLQRHPQRTTADLLPGALDQLWEKRLRKQVEAALLAQAR